MQEYYFMIPACHSPQLSAPLHRDLVRFAPQLSTQCLVLCSGKTSC